MATLPTTAEVNWFLDMISAVCRALTCPSSWPIKAASSASLSRLSNMPLVQAMVPPGKAYALTLLLAIGLSSAWAEEPADEEVVEETSQEETVTVADNGNGIDSPKTMSGMSILGNEEAPKSLVIVPWKSSRMGDEIDLSDTLDDRAQPVDKDVFLRELRFHEIRSGDET